MDIKEYIKSIHENDFTPFENDSFKKDAFNEYHGKTLLEYLLEKGYHNCWMDKLATFDIKWIKLYLKYNVLEPIMECNLDLLMSPIDGSTLIDSLLKKLSNEGKIKLYYNIQKNDYWKFHVMEDEIISIYENNGIIVPKIFFKDSFLTKPKPIITDDLFKEFEIVFSNYNKRIIEYILNIFKKNYQVNPQRVTNDMLRLIDYKKNNPDFIIVDSHNTEGEFAALEKRLAINMYSDMIFNHELSHIMFQIYENESNDEETRKFNLLRLPLLNEEKEKEIKKYLERFHKQYEKELEKYREMYKTMVSKKYGSFNNYVKSICKSIIDCKTHMINIDYNGSEYYFIEDETDAINVAVEIIKAEKEEYAKSMVRHHFAAELMIENLIDAIYVGKIFDGLMEIECLSGHSYLYYMEDDKMPLNECIANYDAIKKLPNNQGIISTLKRLIGSEMIEFFDNYLIKNREGIYGR